jgi:predicted TIM-barrel fold metal-dependent hydrolase
MDKYNIAVSMLSITQPGVWFGDAEKAKSLSRACNEAMAQAVRDNPGRFGLFCAVPLPDQDGSLKEIEYAYDTLKADGVGLMTSYGDKWPGDPAFVPVFEELNRRNAVVFIHANGPSCCQNLIPGITPTMAEFDFDTTRCVESLLVNGTLSRFPNMKLIFVHSGGTFPVLAGRLNDRFPKDRMDKVPNGVLYEIKKLYYEVAHATYAAPLAALTKFVPTSQILFGTDYPAEAVQTMIDPLAQFGLSAKDLQSINRGNAERLFPRLKA